MPPKKKNTTTSETTRTTRSTRSSTKLKNTTEETVSTPTPVVPKPAKKAVTSKKATTSHQAPAGPPTPTSSTSSTTTPVFKPAPSTPVTKAKRSAPPANVNSSVKKQKRETAAQDTYTPSPTKTPSTSQVEVTKQKKSNAHKSKLDIWFDDCAGSEDGNEMDLEQLMNWYTTGLKINPESAALFVLAYKLDLPSLFASMKRSEFHDIMKSNGFNNNADIRKVLTTEIKHVKPTKPPSETFTKFYKKAFFILKQTPEIKSIDAEEATSYFKSILDPKAYYLEKPDPKQKQTIDDIFPHVKEFVKFLEETKPVKVINKDQWASFLDFNKNVGKDLTGYSEDGAWPLLLDQYAGWLKEKTAA